jgi:hypothetical protein
MYFFPENVIAVYWKLCMLETNSHEHQFSFLYAGNYSHEHFNVLSFDQCNLSILSNFDQCVCNSRFSSFDQYIVIPVLISILLFQFPIFYQHIVIPVLISL